MLNLNDLKTYNLKDRQSKVTIDKFAKPHISGTRFIQFIHDLPDFLAGEQFRLAVDKLKDAYINNKTIIMGMGAHVIKVGLNPIIIHLLKRGFFNLIAMNGAGIIHDTEIAMVGHTSEDVDSALCDGSFGMSKDTADFINNSILSNTSGFGEMVSQAIYDSNFEFKEHSILYHASSFEIPITAHIGIGSDIIHIHPSASGKSIGEASLQDFRIFTEKVSTLEGGVYLNVGSAVILPEVFLKAVSISRNLGFKLENFTTINMDFNQQYRSLTNVIKRPVSQGGNGINLIGHHEIMFPLLMSTVIEMLDDYYYSSDNVNKFSDKDPI